MDSGEEIPCLNESWTFAGAKLGEWIAGLAGMVIFTELIGANAARSMPLLLSVWIGTTFSMALVRRQFVDEERGVRNFAMDALGFAPPGIPRPASLQPYWSGGRLKQINEGSWYMKLNLDDVLISRDSEDKENTKFD